MVVPHVPDALPGTAPKGFVSFSRIKLEMAFFFCLLGKYVKHCSMEPLNLCFTKILKYPDHYNKAAITFPTDAHAY